MGVAHSGRNNDHLVDLLLESEGIKSSNVELAMRLVDRGRFIPRERRSDAYKDAAWRSDSADPGYLHLSAPCIYANVLENLGLKPGMSFLNIGSGIGYLSTMAGFMIGEGGVNHGVEIYINVVKYADEKVDESLQMPECSAFSWCVPEFYQGNGFQLATTWRYDAIYCGAQVPDEERKDFITGLLKCPGGIAVMPYENSDEFQVYNITSVNFAHFILPDPEEPLTVGPVTIHLQPKSLMTICRERIRSIIRLLVMEQCPPEMRSECEKRRQERMEEQAARRAQSLEQAGEVQGPTPGQDIETRGRERIRGLVARGADLLSVIQRRVQRHQDARRAQIQTAAVQRAAVRGGRAREGAEGRAAAIPLPPPAAAGEGLDRDVQVRITIRRDRDQRTENQGALQQPRASSFRYIPVGRLDGDEPPVEDLQAYVDRERDAEEGILIQREHIRAAMARMLGTRERRLPGEREQEGESGEESTAEEEEAADETSTQEIARPESVASTSRASGVGTSRHSSTAGKRQREGALSESEREMKRKNDLNVMEEGEKGASEESPSGDTGEPEAANVMEEIMDGIGHACDEPIEEETASDGGVDGNDVPTTSTTTVDRGPEATGELGSDESQQGSGHADEEHDDDEEENLMEIHDEDGSEENDDEEENLMEIHDEDDEDEPQAVEEVPSPQELSLKAFHEVFTQRIDDLPISERMKNFVKFLD